MSALTAANADRKLKHAKRQSAFWEIVAFLGVTLGIIGLAENDPWRVTAGVVISALGQIAVLRTKLNLMGQAVAMLLEKDRP